MRFPDPIPTGQDDRSSLDKAAWSMIGPPLYYCEQCLRAVKVSTKDEEHSIKRSCEHHDARVIAPRRSILVGVGSVMPLGAKIKQAMMQTKSAITGRT